MGVEGLLDLGIGDLKGLGIYRKRRICLWEILGTVQTAVFQSLSLSL